MWHAPVTRTSAWGLNIQKSKTPNRPNAEAETFHISVSETGARGFSKGNAYANVVTSTKRFLC